MGFPRCGYGSIISSSPALRSRTLPGRFREVLGGLSVCSHGEIGPARFCPVPGGSWGLAAALATGAIADSDWALRPSRLARGEASLRSRGGLPDPGVMKRVEVDLIDEVHIQSFQHVVCANRQFEFFNLRPLFHDVRLTKQGGEASRGAFAHAACDMRVEAHAT